MRNLKKTLDRMLGRFTMYKLVLGLLALLTVESFVLSALDIVVFPPLELLATVAVAVAVSVVSTWIFGLLFRTKPHFESAVITGFLLYFVLIPTLEPLGLLAVAIAAIAASASKFLLAIRGRHIFNPAALGALVVTTAGLTFSGWWVSNPYFLPLVALGAALIFYRTRRWALGLVFLAAVVVIVVVRSVLTGGSPLEGLGFAFLSTSTVFFAGFMLSEPLTLPPRRWQQLALAVIVALLFAIPFNIGPLFASPQLALVVGNLLAFFAGQRGGVAMEFVDKKQLTPSTWEFSFRPKRPVNFLPGQYLELALPHARADLRGQRRVFSISSAPNATGPVTVGVKVSEPSSSFKKAMLNLDPGAPVRATNVSGDFTLPADATVPVLLVAGGIGITPFASQLAHLADSELERDVVVVYAVAHGDELAYREQLERSGCHVIVISPTEPEALPAHWEYAGADRLSAESLERLVPDVARRHAFVSGPPALVDDARAILKKLGARRVSTDYFSGY